VAENDGAGAERKAGGHSRSGNGAAHSPLQTNISLTYNVYLYANVCSLLFSL